MFVLVLWLAVMGLGATGGAWFLLSRFPEVFFNAKSWRETRGGRASRRVLIALFVLFGFVVLAAAAGLVVSGIKSD